VYNNFNFEDVQNKIVQYDKAKERSDGIEVQPKSDTGKTKKRVTIRPPSVYDSFDFRDVKEAEREVKH